MSNKHKRRSLHQQKYTALRRILTPGESKHIAKVNATYLDKIYSYSTYDAYSRHTEAFLVYMKQVHPECKQLEDCRPYVSEYLDSLVQTGHYSAHTIHLKAKSLGKLFQYSSR